MAASLVLLGVVGWSTRLSTALTPARVGRRSPLASAAVLVMVTPEPKYENPILSLVGRLLPANDERAASIGSEERPLPAALAAIKWDAPKVPERNLERNARRLEKALTSAEWFVTGQVQPALFSEDFVFKDPDVTLSGVRAYAAGVNRLFDQRSSRAEIARVTVCKPSTVEVVWRLSGGVTIGPLALNLKPYVVYTDLVVDARGLIVYQEDRFSIPSWDILLSALLPVLRPLLAPEAPPIGELRAQLATLPR